MLTKKNALPEMQEVTLVDREGNNQNMSILAKKFNERTYLFIADTHLLGASLLAKDALFFIQQLVDGYQLEAENTDFYRHIYHESMGSLFGRFIVNWNSGSDASYRFQMLSNIDDMVGVNKILSEGEDSILMGSEPAKIASV